MKTSCLLSLICISCAAPVSAFAPAGAPDEPPPVTDASGGHVTPTRALFPADAAFGVPSGLNLACVGDSITFGYTSTHPGGDTAYPAIMGAARGLVYGDTARNLGVPGLQLHTRPCEFDYLLRTDRQNWMIVMLGINDVANNRDADETMDRLLDYVGQRQRAGWLVTVCTTTGVPVFDAGHKATLAEVNRRIKLSFSSVCDVAADPNIGAGASGSPTYYYVDGIHLTDVGYALLASIINATPTPSPQHAAIVPDAYGLTRDSTLTAWLRNMYRADLDQVEPWCNMVQATTTSFNDGQFLTSGSAYWPQVIFDVVNGKPGILFPAWDQFDYFLGPLWSTLINGTSSVINVVMKVRAIAGTSSTSTSDDGVFSGGPGLFLKQANTVIANGGGVDASTTLTLGTTQVVSVRIKDGKLGIRVNTDGSWTETTMVSAVTLSNSVLIGTNAGGTKQFNGWMLDWSTRNAYSDAQQARDDAYFRARYGVE